ncbi:MAG: hypothetical protein ABI613_01600 [Gemmatimonadota bacterium]
MADPGLTRWLEQHTGEAPLALRDRVRLHLRTVARSGSVAESLSQASRVALDAVAAAPGGGRAIALDLLAADALITLALLAQAESSPALLQEFAASLLREPVGTP